MLVCSDFLQAVRNVDGPVWETIFTTHFPHLRDLVAALNMAPPLVYDMYRVQLAAQEVQVNPAVLMPTSTIADYVLTAELRSAN